MKLALIGCDSESLALLREVLDPAANANRDSHFQLVAAFDLGSLEQQVIEIAGAVETRGDWESLLLASNVDAILVSRGQIDPADKTGFSGQERRCEQLRKIVQSGIPAIVIHPGCEEIVGFELEMVRSDQKGVIVPWFPGFQWDAIAELLRLTTDENSPLGTVEQITVERTLSERGRGNVLMHFSRDVEILRRLLGTINKVTASGPISESLRDPMAGGPKPLLPLANLSVHLSGQRPFAARWSVLPVSNFHGATFNLTGTKGTATLRIPAQQDQPWQLDISGSQPHSQSYPHCPTAEELKSVLATAAADPQSKDWLGACRSMEATGCIDRSLQRGRAIEIFNEEHSEAGTFKGIMAASGCLILMATPFLLIGLAALEGILGTERSHFGWWPIVLAAPMMLFLLLQLLLGLTRKTQEQ